MGVSSVYLKYCGIKEAAHLCHPLLRQELATFHQCCFICIQISNILGLPVYVKLTNRIFQISSSLFFSGDYGPGMNSNRNE